MRSVNKVILVGNLTRDPNIKHTTTGQSIVTFGVATNREWVTPNGKQSLAEFHNIAAFGKLAELCHKYLKKGKLVYLEGYLKTRSWDTPEGVRCYRTEVVITDMIMPGKREDDEFGSSDHSDSETAPLGDDDFFDPDMNSESHA